MFDVTAEAICAYTFFLEWLFTFLLQIQFIYPIGRKPFQFPVSFCLSFGELHLSRDLSISSVLSNLLAQNFQNSPGDFMAESQTKPPLSEETVFLWAFNHGWPCCIWPPNGGPWGHLFPQPGCSLCVDRMGVVCTQSVRSCPPAPSPAASCPAVTPPFTSRKNHLHQGLPCCPVVRAQ